jgi:hypothetical protein
MLEISALSKQFDGAPVLAGIDFSVRPSQLFGPICARIPKIPCIFPSLAGNLGFRDEFAHERAKGTAMTRPSGSNLWTQK